MSLQDVLAPARLLLVRFMEDTCVIERKTGTILDPETALEIDVWTTVYAGPCKVKPVAAGRDAQSGEQEVVLHRYRLQLPYSAATPILPEDRATITASADPWLVDRQLQVVDVSYSATSASRKLIIEDRA